MDRGRRETILLVQPREIARSRRAFANLLFVSRSLTRLCQQVRLIQKLDGQMRSLPQLGTKRRTSFGNL
jgi:hypothetical protein